MGNAGNKLDDLGNIIKNTGDVLESINQSYGTISHGYDKVTGIKNNFNNITSRFDSGANKREEELALAFIKKRKNVQKKTLLFCIFIIVVTALICNFL